jgi:hypothetical protein
VEWEQLVAKRENPCQAAAARVVIHVLPGYSGEYIINCITLVNYFYSPGIRSIHIEEVPSAEPTEGESINGQSSPR